MNTKSSEASLSRESRRKYTLAAAIALGLLVAGANALAAPPPFPAYVPPPAANDRDRAKRIFERLVGTAPTKATLDTMEGMVASGPSGELQAALFAIDPSKPESSPFYTYMLKNFALPWTNRDQQVFVPLNDYAATVIGMVRDDEPFNTALSADILYVGASSSGAPAYDPANNNHYQFLDDHSVDLRTSLTKTTQSAVTGLPANATAGLITTRGASSAFFIAGTNRAMFRFTMMNHLCHDMEQVQQTGYPPDRIRQDVSRSPGGDSRIFLNSCIGCHSGMDPMAQAFAYYNFNETTGRTEYTPGAVQPKYLINSDNFKPGFVTPNDNWENRWRQGPNSNLGFSLTLPGSGAGAKSLGQELANSDAFAKCQVEKVFKQVCYRAPSNQPDRDQVTTIVGHFKTNNYSLRQVFAETAVYCKGL